MKAVMISIQPKGCELIASGKKTIEVRKTRPNIDTPFKCYIYCTKERTKDELIVLQPFGYQLSGIESSLTYRGNCKVIGEFVCNRIIEIGNYQEVDHSYMLWVKDRETTNKVCKNACLSEFEKYGNTNTLYGWHISDLVIYDKPKSLEMFPIGKIARDCGCGSYMVYDKILTSPPRSWQYVEEKEQ